MSSESEITCSDYVSAIELFLERRMSPEQFRTQIFKMNVRRKAVSEEVHVLMMRIFGVADDYDPVVRLPYTITEDQLRAKLILLLAELKTACKSG